MKQRAPIPVTKPYMPDQSELSPYIEQIWEREWLTNNGPLLCELEGRLRSYLGSQYLRIVANGTLALQLSIRALELSGEVITTPFSYVATTSSLVWERCKPVFVDIDRDSLNIDADLIESAITERTTGILATHVYGNPCDINTIQSIADRHGLKVLYDAAHGFGSLYRGRSVYDYGDISIASFHATKLYHMVEGGAVFSNNAALDERVSLARNFGHDGPERFTGVGVNAKSSELHAAVGLCVLSHIDEILDRRKEQSEHYDQILEGVPIRRPRINRDGEFNYAYYPVLFESQEALSDIMTTLEENGIFPRRYFHPLLSQLDYVDAPRLPVAEFAASRVLCLPLYHSLSPDDQQRIGGLIRTALRCRT